MSASRRSESAGIALALLTPLPFPRSRVRRWHAAQTDSSLQVSRPYRDITKDDSTP
jgi:hypothetical protein